mmetsp:Transcript_33626/g.89985  ORF Transcript_33626/g.89985 Transcript_33626/m.89985 type:complete len:211 (-) Transcript_33626:554-1186(-)
MTAPSMFHLTASRSWPLKQPSEVASDASNAFAKARGASEVGPSSSRNSPRATDRSELPPPEAPEPCGRASSSHWAICWSSGKAPASSDRGSPSARAHSARPAGTSTFGSFSASLSRQMAFRSSACRRNSGCRPAASSAGSNTLLKHRSARLSMLMSMKTLPISRHSPKYSVHSSRDARWAMDASQASTASPRRPSPCASSASRRGFSDPS